MDLEKWWYILASSPCMSLGPTNCASFSRWLLSKIQVHAGINACRLWSAFWFSPYFWISNPCFMLHCRPITYIWKHIKVRIVNIGHSLNLEAVIDISVGVHPYTHTYCNCMNTWILQCLKCPIITPVNVEINFEYICVEAFTTRSVHNDIKNLWPTIKPVYP